MPSYATGSAKQNPETKAVAVRTIFPDLPDFADRQWGVMTVNNGGHYASHADVAHWPDMIPEAVWEDPAQATEEEPDTIIVPATVEPDIATAEVVE